MPNKLYEVAVCGFTGVNDYESEAGAVNFTDASEL